MSELTQIWLVIMSVVVFWFTYWKLDLDERRNKLLGNLEALQAIKDATAKNAQANRDAAAALKDLAAKSAAGQDISAELITQANIISGQADATEAAVAAAGEPTGTPETPTA